MSGAASFFNEKGVMFLSTA